MRKIAKLKMSSKRGLMNKFVVYLVLMVVITIAMLLFEGYVRDMYERSTERNICKTSIMMQDKLTFKNLNLASDIHIKCPTKEVEIDNKEPEQVKYIFAKEWYGVCDEFNKGNLNIFGDEEQIFCVIRDIISFKKKGEKIYGLSKYLVEENPKNEDVSYYESCLPYKTEEIDKLYDNLDAGKEKAFNQEFIDTNKEYAIIFLYAKGEDEIKNVARAFFGTTTSHKAMYVSLGIVGLGVVTYVSAGTVPIIGFLAKTVAVKVGLAGAYAATLSGIFSWFQHTKVEWASFFLIREYDEDELKKLKCNYLPAEQK